MKISILTCLIYTACLLLVLPLVALHVPLYHPLYDISRMVEGMSLHLISGALFLALIMLCFKFVIFGVLTLSIGMISGIYVLTLLEQPETVQGELPNQFTLLTINIESQFNKNIEHLRNEIVRTDPDIVVVLEANKKIRQLMLDTKQYAHELPCSGICELVAFSKFPIVRSRRNHLINIWPSERYAEFDIKLDDERVTTIVAVHLTKAWIPKSHWERDKLSRQLQKIVSPFVIAGDFNSAPWSYVLRNIAQKSQIYFQRLPPATWPTEAGMFGIPIDHVGVHGGPRIKSLKGWDGAKDSNHRGLLAEIEF